MRTLNTFYLGTDPAITGGSGGELSFAVGLKNLILDTTAIPGGEHTNPDVLALILETPYLTKLYRKFIQST